MSKQLSNYILSDFNIGKNLKEALSEDKYTELYNAASNGEELSFNVINLIYMYEVEPFKNPIKVKYIKGERVKVFNLSSKDYLDCKSFLLNKYLGVSVLYSNEKNSEYVLDSYVKLIILEFKKYIYRELQLNSELSLKPII